MIFVAGQYLIAPPNQSISGAGVGLEGAEKCLDVNTRIPD